MGIPREIHYPFGPMNELIWSFVGGLEPGGGEPTFRLAFRRESLFLIGYSQTIESIPEGLLIEGSAQACGLTLFLEDPAFQFLPVLARVNRSSFLEVAAFDTNYSACPRLLQLSEAGGVFECVCFEPETGVKVAEMEILLGFVPFSDLPEGGKNARSRLKNFISNL